MEAAPALRPLADGQEFLHPCNPAGLIQTDRCYRVLWAFPSDIVERLMEDSLCEVVCATACEPTRQRRRIRGHRQSRPGNNFRPATPPQKNSGGTQTRGESDGDRFYNFLHRGKTHMHVVIGEWLISDNIEVVEINLSI
jgi:hypothetical protein